MLGFTTSPKSKNYVAAVQLGWRVRGGLPLSLRFIREMQDIHLHAGSGASMQPGEFHRSQIWIGVTRPVNALFVPPPPNRMVDCLDRFERFIHRDDRAMPLPIRAGMRRISSRPPILSSIATAGLVGCPWF